MEWALCTQQDLWRLQLTSCILWVLNIVKINWIMQGDTCANTATESSSILIQGHGLPEAMFLDGSWKKCLMMTKWSSLSVNYYIAWLGSYNCYPCDVIKETTEYFKLWQKYSSICTVIVQRLYNLPCISVIGLYVLKTLVLPYETWYFGCTTCLSCWLRTLHQYNIIPLWTDSKLE